MGHGGDPFFISTPLYGHFSPFGKCIFLPSVKKYGHKKCGLSSRTSYYRVPSFPFWDIWNLISFF